MVGQPTDKRGSTIVEVVVAVTLLGVGVLALASTSHHVVRMIGEGVRFSHAAAVGRSVLESALPSACGGETQGDSVVGKLSLRWTVSSGPSLARLDVIAVSSAATFRADTFATTRACIR